MPPESPVARLITELLRRERIANAVSVNTAESVEDLFERIVKALIDQDPTSVARTSYRTARVDRVLSEIQRILRQYQPELERDLRSALSAVGRDQAVRAEQALAVTLGSVDQAVRRTPITQARLRAILTTDPFQGRTLKEHTQRFSANVYDRTLQQIRLGMTNEESIGDIVRRVRGTQAGFIRQDSAGRFVPKGTRGATVRPRFVGGTLSVSTREAEALVRTAVNHVSNVGMLETFKENATVIGMIIFVAVLDDRTSEVCLSYSGQAWRPGDPGIVTPPLHWNCRSVLVAEPDWEKLGLTPPPEPDRIVRDLSTVSDEDLNRSVSARRRTGDLGKVTRIPTSVTANAWLRNQRPAVQNKMLGVGKARLFRQGKINLSDIVRSDMSIVPLSELSAN